MWPKTMHQEQREADGMNDHRWIRDMKEHNEQVEKGLVYTPSETKEVTE